MAERQHTEHTRPTRRSKSGGEADLEHLGTLDDRKIRELKLKKLARKDLLAAPITDDADISTYAANVVVISGAAEASNLLGGRKVLGSSIESELDAHELLRRGLPRAALSTLVENLHVISVDEASEALGVSVRTLQRHKHGPVVRLDVQQSGRAWRFAEILAKATRVLGSQEEAEQWLKRPAIGLDRQRPVDLLTTPAGAKMVETYLGRLEYGVYT